MLKGIKTIPRPQEFPHASQFWNFGSVYYIPYHLEKINSYQSYFLVSHVYVLQIGVHVICLSDTDIYPQDKP